MFNLISFVNYVIYLTYNKYLQRAGILDSIWTHISMQKSRCTDDDFRELILVYYCSFILYSVVEIEREFHLQLEENAKIIFWPYINNFDFCRVWGCEIYRNSRQCQFRMEVYFVAVNELEDNKLLVLHGAMGISIFNVNKIVHAKCSLWL